MREALASWAGEAESEKAKRKAVSANIVARYARQSSPAPGILQRCYVCTLHDIVLLLHRV